MGFARDNVTRDALKSDPRAKFLVPGWQALPANAVARADPGLLAWMRSLVLPQPDAEAGPRQDVPSSPQDELGDFDDALIALEAKIVDLMG